MKAEVKKQPLYHGTDLRILTMSKSERDALKRECILAIDYMWQFIEPYNGPRLSELEQLLQDKQEPYLCSNVIQAISCNELRLCDNSKYSYNYTYLTSDESCAASYAATSWKFGEIGQITYRFYQAIQKIKPKDWRPSNEVCQTINDIKSFVEGPKQPVVVVFYDYDIRFLYDDNGNPVTNERLINGKLIGHFFYKKEIVFNIQDAIPLEEFIKDKVILW